MAVDYKIPNPIKERLARGETSYGLSLHISRSAEIALLARASGHDFLWIDQQHAIYNVETVKNIALTAQAVGVAPIVRVTSVDDPTISLLLDNGVTGIVFPDVETAEQAQRAVNASKFAPIGKRGMSGSYPFFDYQSVNMAEAVVAMNEATLVVAMIESPEGLANADEIAAVEGVDIIHIGMSDMLNNMGLTGKHGSPEIVAALDRVLEVAKAHGKYAGAGGNRNIAAQAAMIKKGVRFITTQTDAGLIVQGATKWMDGIREALAST